MSTPISATSTRATVSLTPGIVVSRYFFHRRLIAQRGASAHTIASYRDTFTLLLGYAAERTGRTPSALTLSDLDAPMVLSFLDHLESERSNSARTRNLRLAAIRSFMRYASLREPTLLPVTQRVLAIPAKCFDRPVLGYLSRGEVTAIINAPDPSTWSGQRDAVLFAVLYNTGARVSEITRLRVNDVLLDRASAVLLHGKGRKERAVPLWKSTAAQLRRWLPRIDRSPDRPVFPNRTGQPLSRSGVEHQLRVACRKASERHPSLATRRISPHTLRHTTAMHLLQSGGRHHRHCPLARPRGHSHNPSVRRSRPGHEGGCAPAGGRSCT